MTTTNTNTSTVVNTNTAAANTESTLDKLFGLVDSLIDNSVTVVNAVGGTTANVAKMAQHSSSTLLAVNILYTGEVLSKYADEELAYVSHVEPSLKLPTPKRKFNADQEGDKSDTTPPTPEGDKDKDSDPEF